MKPDAEQCSRCGRPESPTCCAELPRRKPEVTAADLTDEEIDEVARDAVGTLYLDCLDATTAAPYEARQYSRWVENRDAARERIAAAINARRRAP